MTTIRERIRRTFPIAGRSDREQSYLEQSLSHVDLERRQREIDEGAFAPRRLGF